MTPCGRRAAPSDLRSLAHTPHNRHRPLGITYTHTPDSAPINTILHPIRTIPLRSVDPGLAEELGAPLADALSFFGDAAATAAPAIVVALRGATGCGHYCMEEARLAYRCVEEQGTWARMHAFCACARGRWQAAGSLPAPLAAFCLVVVFVDFCES